MEVLNGFIAGRCIVYKIIRNHAETFSEERFKKEIKEFVELKYNEFNHLLK